MTSFEEILNRPSGEIKTPQPLPVGTYHCLVDGPPAPEESSQKRTPCRTYKFKILSPQGDVDAKEAAEQQVVGKTITGQGAGASFYITEDSAYRYREFLRDHLGIEDADGKKPLKEMEAEAPGKQLLVKIKHDISPDGKRRYHKIDSTMHV
jgi:hypothetical protein